MASIEYDAARKEGRKAVAAARKNNRNPHPVVLSDLVSYEKLSTRDLGVVEIPLSQIIGTVTELRSNSFSWNFYPLEDGGSEFAYKWENIYASQINEGIRDPVRVYEYLHRFYVLEGNKRVSIMRTLGMPVIDAHVIRIMPRGRHEVYEEFCRFFESARMYEIDFTISGEYDRLLRVLGMRLEGRWPTDYVNLLKGALFRFTKVYKRTEDSQRLSISDAFLKYLEFYQTDSLLDFDLRVIASRMDNLNQKLKEGSEMVWRIMVLADEEDPGLWDYWTQEKTQNLDLILSAGDLKPEYLEFLATMSNKTVLYVRGNHDTRYDQKPPLGCIDIDDQVYIWNNSLRICGAGGSMKYRTGRDMYTEKQMKHRLWKLGFRLRRTNGMDIFLAHAPAAGHGDMDDPAHQGFACFNAFLEKWRPFYMINGHVHKTYGDFQRERIHPSGTRIINAYDKYIIEIPKHTGKHKWMK